MIDDEKNIDRLFQEQFKDFEATPDNSVWNNIEAKLNEEKERKIVPFPFWLKLAGTAAAVAIITVGLFTLFNNTTEISIQNKNSVVDTNTEKSNVSETDNTTKKTNVIKDNSNTTNAIVRSNQTNNNTKVTEKAEPTSRLSQPSVTVATTYNNQHQKNNSNKETQRISENNKPESIAMQRSNPRFLLPVTTSTSEENSSNLTNKQNGIVSTDIIDEKAIDSVSNDSTAVAATTLDDILNKEKEDNEEDEATAVAKRWMVAPNMAPVYYNSLSGGSPISNDFSNNDKTGKFNLSYGINVGVQLSKKISLRSGINKVQYGYNTNNVFYSNNKTARFSEAANQNSNINYSNSGEAVLLSGNNMPEYTIASIESNNYSGKQNGTLIQNIDYLEVPFELQYNLIDKKFGLHITGGFSTLLLNNNEILLQTTDDMITNIGEANNINDVNFSTNIGLGMNYSFTQNLLLNVEPMFKYQLNAFSNSNGFNPYSLGIYTGFSFRF